MKKVKNQDQGEMRTEYKREDLGIGVRGKYYEAYKEGHNVVLLKPEVAKAFPSEDAVNEALGIWKLQNYHLFTASVGRTSVRQRR